MPIPRSWPGATVRIPTGDGAGAVLHAGVHVTIDRQRVVKVDGHAVDGTVTDVRFPRRGHAVATFADGTVWNVELKKGCGCG
jgi:flagellar basal body rod protein FlgF